MLYRRRPSEGAAAAPGAEDEEAPFSFGLAVRVGRAVSVIRNVRYYIQYSSGAVLLSIKNPCGMDASFCVSIYVSLVLIFEHP